MADVAMIIVLALSVGGVVAWLLLLIAESLEQVPADNGRDLRTCHCPECRRA